MANNIYNDPFFKLQQTQSLNSAKIILPIINNWIKPNSVIDVGCGVGSWLKAYAELGLKKYIGIDGDYVKKENLVIDTNYFVTANLEDEIIIEEKYDLLICLEVAEHLQPKRAESFVNNLCQMSEVILFSAALPNQEGTLHFNEQYPTYWIEKFKNNNYECIDCVRPLIWNNDTVEFWYKQNTMLFIKQTTLPTYSILQQLPTFNGNSIIHPNLFNYKNEKLLAQKQIADSPLKAIKNYLSKTLRK
jgi:SAM-dependent methyltransferase